MQNLKTTTIAAALFAASSICALAQTSGGTAMGNGVTARGMNSISKHNRSSEHHRVVKRVRRKNLGNQSSAPTCTQEGKRASASAYHC